MTRAREDLAGPGPGDYAQLEQVLPRGYETLLGPRDTQLAITEAKQCIEEGLCEELGLIRVQVPLIVDAASGARTSGNAETASSVRGRTAFTVPMLGTSPSSSN